MTAFETYPTDTFLQKFGKDVFEANVRAFNPQTAVQVAGIISAGVFAVLLAAFLTLQPIGSSDLANAQGAALSKTDRLEAALPDKCRRQAWGAWSDDCTSAINGDKSVRKISYVTVGQPVTAPNTTVLARVPARG